MKKFLLLLLVLVMGLGISSFIYQPNFPEDKIPEGKYCSSNSYVIVEGNVIRLIIDGYSAGSFEVVEYTYNGSNKAPTFKFSDDKGQIHDGLLSWRNNNFLLVLGQRLLEKCD